MNRIDLTGKRFGKWTVISIGDMKDRKPTAQSVWRCICDCGVEKPAVLYAALTSGRSSSCGCMRGRPASEIVPFRRGKEKEYAAWLSLKTRCYNEKMRDYHNWGGRGIKVCDRWRSSFENFYADMGPKPEGDFSLDRKNNDGDYTPENCRWVSRFHQQNNRRSVSRIAWKWGVMSLTEICRRENVCYIDTYQRMSRGWTLDRAISVTRENGAVFKERAKGVPV